MKKISCVVLGGIRLFLRILFLPISGAFIGVTALFEFMSNEPDWEFWKQYNEPLLKCLPSWQVFRNNRGIK